LWVYIEATNIDLQVIKLFNTTSLKGEQMTNTEKRALDAAYEAQLTLDLTACEADYNPPATNVFTTLWDEDATHADEDEVYYFDHVFTA